jgi:DNA-binding Lrp family transcriptional regulator
MNLPSHRGTAAVDRALRLFLCIMEDGGATPLSSLAKHIGVPQPTAQRAAAALLRAGLVGRVVAVVTPRIRSSPIFGAATA